MKLEVESDPRAIHTWIYVAVATPLVVIGYLASGVLLAVAAWILSAALVQAGFVIVERRQLTQPMKDAAEQAVAAFQATYPNDEVTSVALRADEDERYVFSLRYGLGRPTPRRYFAVDKTDATVTEISDHGAYRPKGLK